MKTKNAKAITADEREHLAAVKALPCSVCDAPGPSDPRTASAFLTLVGKVLPLQVKGTGPNGEHVFQKIIVEIVRAK